MASLLSDLRRHSQLTAFVVGLFLAGGGAAAWLLGQINYIFGSLLVGIGSSVIAAALVAYFSPMSEAIYQKFVSLGITDVHASRKNIPADQWVEWLGNSTRTCTLLGIANGNWLTDAFFKGALIDRLKKKVQVRVLFLDPNGKSIQVRAPEDMGRNTADVVRKSIRALWGIRNELDEESKNHLELYVYDATPSCGLTWVDELMVVTHYLAGFANPNSPVLVLRRGGLTSNQKNLYEIYEMNMNKIFESQSTIKITETNVANYS